MTQRGDKYVPLDDRLEAIERALRRLTWAVAAITVAHVMLLPGSLSDLAGLVRSLGL